MAIANSTEDGNHTITKSSVALQFLEQLRTFSFHCICREYFDHCCSSEGFVASSAVETFAQLSGEHRFGRGPHTHPLRGGIHLSRDHSKDWYYFWFLFTITSLLFSGVSLLTMTAIRVDRLLAPFLGLRSIQTGGDCEASNGACWYSLGIQLLSPLWRNLKFHDYHWFGDTPTLLYLVFKDISYVV